MVLGWFVFRQKKRNSQLLKLLSLSRAKLERLQVHFGKFTPEEVIERLTDTDETYTASMRKVATRRERDACLAHARGPSCSTTPSC